MVTTTEADTAGKAGQAQRATGDKTTFGWVRAFTVDETRMLIKLDCSAIFRLLVKVPADHPNFRTAVSLTMLAHTNKVQLSVRYREPDGPQRKPKVWEAVEVGLGDKAFEIEDWNYKPDVSNR